MPDEKDFGAEFDEGQPVAAETPQPTTEGAPAEPEPQKPAAQTVTEPTPHGEPTQTPVYKYRGREYTAEQLEKSGLLHDVLTTAEQFPYLQQKYTDTLETMRQGAQAPTQPQPQGQPWQQIRSQLQPVLDASSRGDFGEELKQFADTWPDSFLQGYYRLQVADQRAFDLNRRLANIEQMFTTASTENGRQVFDNTIAELANDPDLAAVKDPTIANQINDRIVDLYGDRPLSQLTPDLIRQTAVSVLWPAIQERLRGSGKPTTPRSRASGDGGSARGQVQSQTDFDKALQELEELER